MLQVAISKKRMKIFINQTEETWPKWCQVKELFCGNLGTIGGILPEKTHSLKYSLQKLCEIFFNIVPSFSDFFFLISRKRFWRKCRETFIFNKKYTKIVGMMNTLRPQKNIIILKLNLSLSVTYQKFKMHYVVIQKQTQFCLRIKTF